MSNSSPTGASGRSDTGRFVVVAPLAVLPLGLEFGTDAWPPHVTLVPPFTSAYSPTQVAELVTGVCRGFSLITSFVDGHSLFGHRRDVPVATLRTTSELRDLHERLLDALAPHTGSIGLRHVGADYRPHVTLKGRLRMEAGSAVTLRQVAVVVRDPHAGRGYRRVAATIDLEA